MKSLKIQFNKLDLRKCDLIIFVCLALVIFSVFYDFLRFSLCCDDWFLLYGIRLRDGNTKALIELFTGPYGGQYFFMYSIRNLFGYNPFFYNLFSLFFRILASFSLYLLGKSLTNNKYIGLLASVLFALGYASIQTSEAVVNSINYLSLVFLNLGVIYLIKYYQDNLNKRITKDYLFSLIMFFLSLSLSPIRANGIFFLFLFLEIILLFSKKLEVSLVFMRVLIFGVLIIVLKYIGFFRPEGSSELNPVTAVFRLLNNPAILNTIQYAFANFFEIIFPPVLLDYIKLPHTLSGIFIFIIGLILVGMFFIRGYRTESIKLLIFLLWPFCFLAIPYIYYPDSYSTVDSRYMLISASGLYLFLVYATFITISHLRIINKLNLYIFLIAIYLILVISNLLSVKNFIYSKLIYRDDKVVQSVNQVINDEIKDYLAVKRPLVYIYGEDRNFNYFVITYGGQERIGILNGFKSTNNFPYYITSYENLVDILTNEEIATSFGLSSVEIDDVFAFEVNNRKIKSETILIRENLKNIMFK